MRRVDGKSVRGAADAMNASLRARYEVIRDILAADPSEGIEARHRVGRVLMEITNDAATYGSGALSAVATALGRDETSLYRYAHVAGRWSAEAITRLVARKTAAGSAISWSHLVELSTVPGRREREALLERTLAEALSVRDLVRVVRGASRSKRGRSSPTAVIEQRIAEIEEGTRRLADACADYELFAQLVAHPDGRDRVAELLARARRAHERLQKENAGALGRLAALRRSTRTPR